MSQGTNVQGNQYPREPTSQGTNVLEPNTVVHDANEKFANHYMFNHLLGRVLISSVNHHFSSKQEARKEFVELHRLYGFTIGPHGLFELFCDIPQVYSLDQYSGIQEIQFLGKLQNIEFTSASEIMDRPLVTPHLLSSLMFMSSLQCAGVSFTQCIFKQLII